MEHKRRNAYDAVSDEVLRLFNSDTEEDGFDGFSAQEEDEEGDQRLFLVGYCLFFFFFFLTICVTGTVRGKSICSISLCYYTHLIKSLKILTCNIFLCKYLILQCGL